MHFADTLLQGVSQKGPVCVGIDPHITHIPPSILDRAREELGNTVEGVCSAFLEFSQGIIDAVKDEVTVVKPQIAFFESYGYRGLQVYEEVCAYAKKQGLLVIADVKRGDIASTATAYAEGLLGSVPLFEGKVSLNSIDAVTLSPYMGGDTLEPFKKLCEEEGKGAFVLVKTSNKGSGDLQDLPVGDTLLSEHLAELVALWGSSLVGDSGYSSLGAVVGATYPEDAQYLRSIMPSQIFLVPGYGAQGAGATEMKPYFHKNGEGALINAARSVIYAYKKSSSFTDVQYKEAAREEVIRMKKDISAVIGK